MKKFRKDLIYLGAICVILFMYVSQCSRKNESIDSTVEIAKYKHDARTEHAKNGELISVNRALNLKHKDAMRSIDSLRGYLKNLHVKKPAVIIRTVTDTRIDSIPVPFRVELPCPDFTVQDSVREKWYSFDYTLTKHAFMLTDVSIPNVQEIVVGKRKTGLLKSAQYEVVVKNSNPNMRTTQVGALTFEPEKPFYNRFWFRLLTHGAAFYLGTRVH